jgi:thiamine kinase-like enzyme
VRCSAGHGNWSHQIVIEAQASDGSTRALRLKLCLGRTFGRSEVDYYLRDYVDLAEAPLVRCLDAQFDPAVGYHLLLEDLCATHVDRKELLPTLAHGLALAEALARLHRHHWRSRPAPDGAVLDRYFDEIRPGVAPIERATGQALRERFERHERALRRRWADPQGMTLLHGDLNPTNILSPRGADAPLYFIDRQPFDWSLTYGVAAYDLAYAMVPWWPESTRRANELAVLRRWHEALAQPDYGWAQAQADWALAVEQCLHVPIEWCSKPDTIERMRALWQVQLARIQDALARPGGAPSLQTQADPTTGTSESPSP